MNFITSYDICHMLNEKPTRENIEKYIKLVGGDIDSEHFDNFMDSIANKSYDEILEIGSSLVTLQSAVKPAADNNTDSSAKNKTQTVVEDDEDDESDDIDFDF